MMFKPKLVWNKSNLNIFGSMSNFYEVYQYDYKKDYI